MSWRTSSRRWLQHTEYAFASGVPKRENMRSPAQRRRRARMALLALVVLLAASNIHATTTQSSQSGCVPYDSSSTAGNLWDVPSDLTLEDNYFGCADGGFLVGSASNSSVNPVDALSWTCTDGDVIGSISSGFAGEELVSFTVGITAVRTGVEEEEYPYLGDVYIGGFDVDFDGAGVTFSWKGALAEFEYDDIVLPDSSFSSCGNDSYATGVTVWSSTIYVYGVVLECADVTETCAPPGYPANLIPGATNLPTPSPSAVVASTDPPSPSPDTVGITPPPSPSEGTTPAVDTPSPSVSTTTSPDADSAEVVSTGESSSSSVSTMAVVGGSVAGGLFLIAVCIGALCCFYRHNDRKDRHPDNPRDTFSTPAPMARRDRGGGGGGGGGGGSGGGTASEGESVPPAIDARPVPASDPRGPPPPYVARPLGQARLGAPSSSIP